MVIPYSFFFFFVLISTQKMLNVSVLWSMTISLSWAVRSDICSHGNYFQSRFIIQSFTEGLCSLLPLIWSHRSSKIIDISIPLSRSHTTLRGLMANLCRDRLVFRNNQMEFFFKSSQSLPQPSMVEVSKFPCSFL